MKWLLLALSLGANAQDYYGAYAVSYRTVHYGYSANQTTLERARNEALRDCGGNDCMVLMSVKNGCIALVENFYNPYSVKPRIESWRQWYSSARSIDRREAERVAVDLCDFNARDTCHLMHSFCTFGTPPPLEEPFSPALLSEDETRAILRLVNTANAFYLQNHAGLSAPGAQALHRYAAFSSIRQLYDLISPGDIERLRAHAFRLGYL